MDERHKHALEVRILTGIIARMGIRALEQRLSEMSNSLSHLQFAILRNLSEQPQTISELSKRFFLDPSTLVSSVDALEKKGFVRRERDPNDRRRVPLFITDEGRALVNCIPIMTDDDPLVEAVESIGEEHIDHLLKVLREIVNRMPDGPHMLEHVMQRLNFNNTESE